MLDEACFKTTADQGICFATWNFLKRRFAMCFADVKMMKVMYLAHATPSVLLHPCLIKPPVSALKKLLCPDLLSYLVKMEPRQLAPAQREQLSLGELRISNFVHFWQSGEAPARHLRDMKSLESEIAKRDPVAPLQIKRSPFHDLRKALKTFVLLSKHTPAQISHGTTAKFQPKLAP